MENGAYDKRWPSVHMFPEEGVQAHLDLRGAALMPVHWGMFNLANHDWQEPIRRISAAAKAKGVRLLTPRLGQVLRPLENPAPDPWWEPPPQQPTNGIGAAPALFPEAISQHSIHKCYQDCWFFKAEKFRANKHDLRV